VLPLNFITKVTASSTSSLQQQQPSVVVLHMLRQASHLRPETPPVEQQVVQEFYNESHSPINIFPSMKAAIFGGAAIAATSIAS